MKTVCRLTTLVGILVVAFALGTAGAKGQALNSSRFTGTFTLPFEADWGNMTLPAGEYSLQYGQLFPGGLEVTAIIGKATGSPKGWIYSQQAGPASASKNALVCVRAGNILAVRTLELPAIGKSVSFPVPGGAKLTAHIGKPGANGQIADGPKLIQQVPITLNAR